ncbi:uncharacterized protein LOC120769601 isoform X1 [Bactrocera tryoni]|uniref:uncharacterized protein LOC120769601 isoform X1 n=2 Tax=Bactrocera tryoni TaxID=59916 RepID=UPI001A979225|nr:uncharacterized protein LOC120769601 isoform X1 [Bactrocera tryoni]XP_039952610.1 uncharacterized protein LOC120769601 isoform X1 [Bactrocera tryoni]XP_039952611.1 uncharacterized protein LOC120769601 isoform X1 [Bactrocera tryoni]XP_039952612.1 uncharacterized protein LOC120769601 isoform X1 [Bactrocera tryoni]XP_039952614.1 uncharacterized protein LOC120769601 isoform X1 [Bactrocera tryoni]
MPEILTTIPPLTLAIENLSETDGVSTDRSSTSGIPSPGGEPRSPLQNSTRCEKNPMHTCKIKKPRKSIGRRNQKKVALKVGVQQKNTTTLCLKSQIPRVPLRKPSPSSTLSKPNVFCTLSPRLKVQVDNPEYKLRKQTTISETEVQPLTTPNLVQLQQCRNHISRNLELATRTSNSSTTQLYLRGQNTAAILNFRIRKSITQMDLKRTRRDNANNYSLLASPQSQSLGGLSTNPSALMPNRTSDIAGLMGVSSQTSLVNKMFDQNNYYYVIQDRDPKVAGMRIFATIMLNAWRKRRDEVKRLMEEVNNLKRGSIKAKNQLHVFNTLFRVEQKRNDELSVQLKRSLEDINNTKSSCESLTTSLISLKADKALLEQQIQIKEQEFDGLNAILSQTKSDLFKAMAQQRELQANLSSEQRKVQALEAQKKELINEICEVNNESLQKEEKLQNEIKEKNDALTTALTKLESFEWEINELKQKTLILDNCLEVESHLRKEVANLSREVETLQQCLAATLGNRIRSCWNNSIAYQRATLHLVHWIAYCTLPATPPPKIKTFPFGLTLEKALNIVKR